MAETTFGRRDPASFPMPGIEITHSVARPREKKPFRVPAEAKTPDELEASFIQLFKDYTKAAAAARSEEKNDCEKKLIKVIDLKEAVPLMINLLKDDKCGKRLASSILWTFEELTHVAYEVPSQKEQVAKLMMIYEQYKLLRKCVFTEDQLYKNRLVLGTGTLPVVIELFQLLQVLEKKKQKNRKEKKKKKTSLDGQELGDYIYGSAIAFENEDLGLDIAIFPASMDMIHGVLCMLKKKLKNVLYR
ncbi:hypothetical protein C5167_034952 [Papaver somniferum]|uniref:Uncharacterized protein n=1 Tax=Papaver somniferum TaxID=3469 RepID=A0A4Y7KHG9_PAPSO|nr:hypothetical protein C5167_034952 [Papaver somniferum]